MQTHPYERLMARVVPDGECLLAPVNTDDGYFVVWDNSRKTMVKGHRLVYEQERGPIPPGMTIDHLCRRRNCQRIEHLEVVTRKENTARGEGPSAQHSRKTHCPKGHPYNSENTRVYKGRRYCIACDKARKR